MSSEDLLTKASEMLKGFQDAKAQLQAAINELDVDIEERTAFLASMKAELAILNAGPVDRDSKVSAETKPKRSPRRAPAKPSLEPVVEVKAIPVDEIEEEETPVEVDANPLDDFDDWTPGEVAMPDLPTATATLDNVNEIEF